MARIVFISPYIKGGQGKTALSRRTNYIATRDGVERIKSDKGEQPAGKKQRTLILRLLEAYPQMMELGEYEDYFRAQTADTAAELIDRTLEQFVTAEDQRENYLDYVAHRPGVQKEGDHGLWDRNGKVENLSKAVAEVADHAGNVWTPVVSLRREDAERLGYTNAENWRALVNACSKEIADGYKIAPENLRWYAALHEKEKHIHIHLILFSKNPKEGYLTKQGIRDIKSAFASRIFEQDLLQVYERKTEYRNELQHSAEREMAELIFQMETGRVRNKKLEQLTAELAQRLQNTKGRKVYGYLPPQVKRIVDAIVDELARDERVAAAYSLWQEMQDEVCRTYSDTLPERLPLSRQKEFKPVRNMVIREALKLSEKTDYFEDEDMEDEPAEAEEPKEGPSAEEPESRRPKRRRFADELAERYLRTKAVLCSDDSKAEDKRAALSALERLYAEGYAIAAHQLGRAHRDGLGTEKDLSRAAEWFRLCALRGYDCSAYALGKLLLERGEVESGIDWLKRAAEQGNQYAQYRLGKICLLGEQAEKNVAAALEYLRSSAEQGNQYAQYALGKLYLLGKDVPQNREQGLEYLNRSAAQGNVYARFLLDRPEDTYSPPVGLAVLRMLHHMGRIFRDNAVADATHKGIQIDRKRRRQLQEKRIAMGHKPDDHEEEQGQTMQ